MYATFLLFIFNNIWLLIIRTHIIAIKSGGLIDWSYNGHTHTHKCISNSITNQLLHELCIFHDISRKWCMQNVRSTNDDNTTNDIRPVAFLRPDRITVAEARYTQHEWDARNGMAGRTEGRKARHFVRGQGSLEFHTWINSPASGVRFTSFLLVLRLPLVPSSSTLLSPPPRGKPCYANSEIHPVQPLMNARELRQPPPLSQPPPTPHGNIVHGSAWQRAPGRWSRGRSLGVRFGRGVIFARWSY